MATTENKNYNLIDPMTKIDISPYNENFENIDRDMAEIAQTATAAKSTAEDAKKQVEAAGGKIMTAEELGVGKVDGETIGVAGDGTLSVIAKAKDIPAEDTSSILGDSSSPTTQALIDAIANKVVNELVTNSALTSTLASYMTKSLMSNVNADNSDMVPTLALTNSMQNAIDTLNSKIGFLTFVESNNIDDYNQKGLESVRRILYGLIDNQAYISFDIAWIRIQFCTDYDVLKRRIIYGASDVGDWKSLS